jgi:hypothetical protein
MAFQQPDLAAELPRRLSADRAAWLFVGLGVVLRLARYLLDFPLWCDEYQLAANLLVRGFSDLLKPLDHNQVAPIGFLWIESAAVRLLGFSELSLRLFPALCGIAGVCLFRHVASQLLRGVPFVLAVAIFAVAYYPIRHSAEVKPYSSDLFLSLLLFSVVLNWWRAPGQTRWLWVLAGLAPLALAISFTAAFVAGGLGLGIAWTLWQRRRDEGARSAWLAWVAFDLAVGIAFLGLMRLNVSAQYDATRNEMTACWADGFPPWRRPLELAVWIADVHTGEMFAYPVGAEHGGSILTFVCFALGLVEMIRRGHRDLAVTVIGWFGLSLIAAALHRYPYGSHARLSQYLAPAICLLAGSGAALLLERVRRVEWRAAAIRGCLAGGVVIALVMLTRDVIHPYKMTVDRVHRDFLRRFWTESPEIPTICVQTDLGLRFYDRNFETSYLCNQRIHSPAHRKGPQPAAASLMAADRPLRCVVFHSKSARRNEPAFAVWMKDMLTRYDLLGAETHEAPLSTNHDDLFDFYMQCYDVYRFAPRREDLSPSLPDELAGRPADALDRR